MWILKTHLGSSESKGNIQDDDPYNYIKSSVESTEVTKTVRYDDMDGALRAWVVLIHTYNMDLDLLLNGQIGSAHEHNRNMETSLSNNGKQLDQIENIETVCQKMKTLDTKRKKFVKK